MRKVFISMIFLFSAAFCGYAQQTVTPAPTPADNPNAPEISFEKTVHDYGTIVKGGDGTCEFKFTNIGKEPLILSKPISSCGCTVPTWPQEPILPGKSDVIKVTYNTNNVGNINKSVTVYSNAKTNRVVLSIKGQVVATPATTLPEKPAEQTATPIQK
ncbi:MAG TPA: DUF1573 domain-containing protein [Bacteroidales bacterium]|nr:DUF1573 domain-containing protein [Bacteroidales bacterium]HPS72701.1 DUF1573 domain-containing protein [Bacteroidales bacterium]